MFDGETDRSMPVLVCNRSCYLSTFQNINTTSFRYQQGVSSPPFTPETSLEQEVPPANAEQPQPANVAAAPAAARRQADQGNMVMNAQGGMVDADDEDIAANRDWLDWVYMMTRFAVLLAIVYFYSTLGRFLFIFSLFLFFYL